MTDTLCDNFLGLPSREARYDRARFAVLPIPYDASTSFGVGTREGPRAIITASQQVEFLDEYLGVEPELGGIATLDPLQPDARGPQQTVERIERVARRIVRDRKFLVGLGGEHSITTGLVRAVRAAHKGLCVLQLDAHADLRDEFHGSPYSHAAVMRRIHTEGVPIVGVGIRNYSADELRYIKAQQIPLFSPRFCRDEKNWVQHVVNVLDDPVYITIDIDGFDPAYAPGTGTPEPGGLDWFQVTDLLAAVSRERTIVAADVVEVRPLPPSSVTEFLAARLIYRLMGLVVRSQPRQRRRSR